VDATEKSNDRLGAKKRKRTRHSVGPCSSAELGKDCQFSFFHILGKILYNKEGTNLIASSLADQPVISDAGFNPIMWLHENIPDFVEDIFTLERSLSAFSFSDSVLRYLETNVPNDFVFRTLTLSSRSGGSQIIIKGFSALRKPSFYDRNRSLMERSAFLARLPLSSTCRGTNISYVHKIMERTMGEVPVDWPNESKMLVFKFFHPDQPIYEYSGAHMNPNELEDDPLEDC
jgi:hypothetical protein